MKKLYNSLFGSPMRNRFTLFFIMITLVPVLALGSIALYFIDLSHRVDVAALETQLIDQKIAEINTFLSDTQGAMDIQVAFDQKSQIQLDQQAFLLKGLLDENHAFIEVRLENLQGIVTARQRRDGKTSGTESVAPEQVTGGTEDVSLLPEFMTTRDGTAYVGPVQETLSGPVITLAMPVHNRVGDIIQILAADVSLRDIAASMDTARLGQSGYLLLFDKNGSLITSPSSDVPLGSDFSHHERVAQILAGKTLYGSGAHDLYASYINGTPVFGAGKAMPKLGWIILTEWPVDDANGVIDDLRLQVLGLTILSIIIVLLTTPLFVSRLTKPIHQLEDAAHHIEAGEFDQTVDIQTGDELQNLGEQFNTMAKGLKRLQELRTELIHIMTHELRAPVTAIKYATASLRAGDMGALTPEVSKLIEPMWVSSEHLFNLVNDLLEVATSEAGKLQFKITAIDPLPIINEVLQELQSFAAEHHVALAYDPNAAAGTLVSVDTMRFKQVLMNFISNAIKYNKENGSVSIRHEVTPTEIITHVTDTGKGLSEEDQSHLFEKFYRSAANDKKIIGTGLGLFITKDLIEKMGGKVSVTSKLGEGTTFSFSLPRA